MNIKYRTIISENDIEQLNNLIDAVGWGTRSIETWKKIFKISSYILIAEKDNHIVGMGRIVDDGAMCMVYDIAVLPEYQKQQIASTIMQKITSQIKEGTFNSIGLFAWDKNPYLKKFYKKFGFKEVCSGMQLK